MNIASNKPSTFLPSKIEPTPYYGYIQLAKQQIQSKCTAWLFPYPECSFLCSILKLTFSLITYRFLPIQTEDRKIFLSLLVSCNKFQTKTTPTLITVQNIEDAFTILTIPFSFSEWRFWSTWTIVFPLSCLTKNTTFSVFFKLSLQLTTAPPRKHTPDNFSPVN